MFCLCFMDDFGVSVTGGDAAVMFWSWSAMFR